MVPRSLVAVLFGLFHEGSSFASYQLSRQFTATSAHRDHSRRNRTSRFAALLGSTTPELFDNSVTFSATRRAAFGLVSLYATLLPLIIPDAAGADNVEQQQQQQQQPQLARPLLRVTITLNPNLDDLSLLAASSASTSSTSAAALYITARPNTVDNVPRAILDGSMGKPPPVLVARIPNVTTFPFQVILTNKDVTVEGGATSTTSMTTVGTNKNGAEDCPPSPNNDSNVPSYSNNYWWLQGGASAGAGGLVVSARLDSDGVAATRDPTDLVGRTTILLRPTSTATAAASAVVPQQEQQQSGTTTNDYCQPSQQQMQQDVVASVTVELQGRGVAGKFFTSQKNR